MNQADGVVEMLLIGASALFWIGMLGLLWRRSLVGMLVGLSFAWISVGFGAIAFNVLQAAAKGISTDGLSLAGRSLAAGGALVSCVALIGCLQIAVGLSVVVSRIRRRGTLDADDAALLEG